MLPQVIIILWTITELFFAAYKHGERVRHPYNFWSALLTYAIWLLLPYSGGFFDVWMVQENP
jgi:hypothetical protein